MTHCRMCSQRLTRPGRLCRECERELDRARFAAASVDELAASIPTIDASRVGTGASADGWRTRVRARAPLVAAAFALGLAGAATLYVLQRTTTSAVAGSVMLDRDVADVRPRRFTPVGHAVPADAGTPSRDTASMAAPPPPRHPPAPRSVALATPATADAPNALDRVLAFSNALASCAEQSYFERLACEQRARSRYCDGAGTRLPQCADEAPRERGQ